MQSIYMHLLFTCAFDVMEGKYYGQEIFLMVECANRINIMHVTYFVFAAPIGLGEGYTQKYCGGGGGREGGRALAQPFYVSGLMYVFLQLQLCLHTYVPMRIATVLMYIYACTYVSHLCA